MGPKAIKPILTNHCAALPVETILQILSFTQDARTICRASQACKCFKTLIDDNPIVWKSTPELYQCLLSDAILKSRNWSPLKLLRILQGWNNKWKYSGTKGEVLPSVAPLSSLQDDPEITQIMTLFPLGPDIFGRLFKSQDWDLGDGSFATFVNPTNSKTQVCFIIDSFGGCVEYFSDRCIQRSRYCLSSGKESPFGIHYWEKGQNAFKIHCSDYTSILSAANITRGFIEAFGNILINWCLEADTVKLSTIDIPSLTLAWTTTISDWPTHLRFPKNILYMNDAHVIMTGWDNFNLKIWVVLDVATGEIVKFDRTDRNLGMFMINPTLFLDSLVSCSNEDPPRLAINKITQEDIHWQKLRRMMAGRFYFHKLSEALFSWKLKKNTLHLTVFDAIKRKVTHFEIERQIDVDTKRGICCLYRGHDGVLKIKLFQIDLQPTEKA